jgi:tryptophan-rich sensory protein
MSFGYALLVSCKVCALAAGLEGACAGRNVKAFFSTLKFPRYSAPLWVWSIIGGGYYLIFGFVLYRLFRLTTSSVLKPFALTLIIFMMIVNALSNYVIFRDQNLRLSAMIGNVFPVMDIALFVSLIQLDTLAAWSLVPYLIYRIYAVWWGYALWKSNRPV